MCKRNILLFVFFIFLPCSKAFSMQNQEEEKRIELEKKFKKHMEDRLFAIMISGGWGWDKRSIKSRTNEMNYILASGKIDVNAEKGYTRNGWKDGKHTSHMSPLHLITFELCLTEHRGPLEILQLLASYPKVDVNYIDPLTGRTPLHLVSKKDHQNCVKAVGLFLKRNDINVNVPDNDGDTPLHETAREGNTEAATLLLNREEIEINKHNNAGNTPLHVAIANENVEMTTLLLNREEIEINKHNNAGNTPLHIAAKLKRGMLEITKLLLGCKGIRINECGKYNYTPLHQAAHKGNFGFVELLLDCEGIKVNERSNQNHTPLHTAVRQGCIKTTRALLKHKDVTVNVMNDKDETPLSAAFDLWNFELVSLLLGCEGIKVDDEINKNGKAHLRKAVEKQSLNFVTLLLDILDQTMDLLSQRSYLPIYLAMEKATNNATSTKICGAILHREKLILKTLTGKDLDATESRERLGFVLNPDNGNHFEPVKFIRLRNRNSLNFTLPVSLLFYAQQ